MDRIPNNRDAFGGNPNTGTDSHTWDADHRTTYDVVGDAITDLNGYLDGNTSTLILEAAGWRIIHEARRLRNAA